jgi:hypothetical protein
VPEAGGPLEWFVFVEAMVYVGRRERQRLKSGEGKTVSALTRMLVMVSSRAR